MPKRFDLVIGLLIATAFWAVVLLWQSQVFPAHPEGDFLGIKLGEWLIGGATVALFVATRGLVRETKATSKRQLRAYMGIRNMGTTFVQAISVVPTENGPVQTTIPVGPVCIYTVNYGQTPAKRATMYIHECAAVPSGAPDHKLCQKVVGPQIVHPGQELGKIAGKKMPDENFFIFGYVDYVDIFDNEWRYCFGFTYSPERVKDGTRDDDWKAEENYNYEKKRDNRL